MKKNHFKYRFRLFLILLITVPIIQVEIHATSSLPTIISSSAILMDASNGQILFAKDAFSTYYPASITKFLTALLAVENLAPEDQLTLSHDAVSSLEYDSTQIGMQEGETITVNQAMHAMLLMSANEVANGIAEKVSGSIDSFCSLMNERALAVGALNTHFVNPNGIHNNDHYTTAYDMAMITKELLKNDYFMSIMGDSTYQIPATNLVNEVRYLSQNHKMLNIKKDQSIYREDVIAGKTGFTDEGRHSLITVAKRGEQTFIVIILKSELSSNAYTDTAKLLDYGFENYKPVQIEATDYQIEVPILTTESEDIGQATLSMDSSKLVELPLEVDPSSIRYEKELPSSLTKDARIGDLVGSVSLYIDDIKLLTSPLVITDLIVDTVTPVEDVQPEKEKEAKRSVLPLILFFLFIIFLILAYIFYDMNYNRNWYSRRKNSSRMRTPK